MSYTEGQRLVALITRICLYFIQLLWVIVPEYDYHNFGMIISEIEELHTATGLKVHNYNW